MTKPLVATRGLFDCLASCGRPLSVGTIIKFGYDRVFHSRLSLPSRHPRDAKELGPHRVEHLERDGAGLRSGRLPHCRVPSGAELPAKDPVPDCLYRGHALQGKRYRRHDRPPDSATRPAPMGCCHPKDGRPAIATVTVLP